MTRLNNSDIKIGVCMPTLVLQPYVQFTVIYNSINETLLYKIDLSIYLLIQDEPITLKPSTWPLLHNQLASQPICTINYRIDLSP